MQLSALYKEGEREGGLQSALIVKCPAQAETGCDLNLAWAGVREIRYFLIIDTYLETITDKGWAGIMTRIKVMQAPSQAEPLQGPTMPLFQDCQSVRDVKII